MGPYRLIRELGRGGMGVVFEAQHDQIDRPVALKVMLAAACDAEGLARFQVEAQAVARLQHPNIVAIHAVGEHRGSPYIVMDFVDGQGLDERLKRQGPLEPRLAAELIQTLCAAVQHAHDRSILHRDLKPANVLLGADGRPWITDFGLAKDLSEERERLTRTGVFLGTPGYMPPEQANADMDQIGRCSDIYSLGATLYALLTGVPPFEGASVVNLIAAVLTQEATAPSKKRPELEPALDAIVLKCLAKAPNHRYLSAAALGEDLGRFVRGERVAARGPKSKKRAKNGSKSSRAIPLALVALGVVIGLSALAVFRAAPAQEAKPDTPLASTTPVASTMRPPPPDTVEPNAPGSESLESSELLSSLTRPPSWSEEERPPEFPDLLFEFKTGKGHARMAVSGDGTRAITSGFKYGEEDVDGRAALWNLGSGVRLKRRKRARLGLKPIAGVPSGDRFLLKEGLVLRVVSAAAGEALAERKIGRTLAILGLSADGSWGAVSTGARHAFPRSALIFDLRSGAVAPYGCLEGHAGRVNSLSFSADSTRLATGSGAREPGLGEISLFDLATQSLHGRVAFKGERITRVAMAPDDRHIAGLTSDGALFLVKVTASGLSLIGGVRAFDRGCEELAWSPDGRYVYAVAHGGGICRWDVKGRALVRWRLKGQSTGLAISPRGTRMFVCFVGRIEVWGER